MIRAGKTISETYPQAWEATVLRMVPIAFSAGDAILEIYREPDHGIEIKSDHTPITRADKAAHYIISQALANTPWPIISEEGLETPYAARKGWTTYWLVDPLDGTREFIKRNGEFTVNIALIHENYPLAGIVYAPVTGELYLGLTGMGAWKFNNPKAVDTTNWLDQSWMKSGKRLPLPASERPFTVVASRSHLNRETQEFIDGLRDREPGLTVANRGSSLKTCLIAEGAADVYPRFGPTMEWDTGAAQAVAEAAGIKVIQAKTGERIAYNKEDLLNPWFFVFDPKSIEAMIIGYEHCEMRNEK